MEISSLGNNAPAQKPAASEPADNDGNAAKSTAGPQESASNVSAESKSSQVPPPNPTSESGNEAADTSTAESQTGGQINISI